MSRPCRYCLAAYPEIAAEVCDWSHRDEQRVYDLAAAMARVFQQQSPTDEQIGWFVDDADAVVDDFQPTPDEWRVRKLPVGAEFDAKFSINDVTYVALPGGKDCKSTPVRLSTYRQRQREADEESRSRLTGKPGMLP